MSPLEKTRTAKSRNAKLLFAILLFILAIAIFSGVAEARFEKTKETIQKSKVFVLSTKFWANVLIIFGIIFVIYALVLANKIGNDSTQKAVVYALIGIVAIVIGTHIVDSNHQPEYIWKNEQLRKVTQFFFGPANRIDGACGGRGAYMVNIKAKGDVCKQAILMPNDTKPGAGLAAFVISGVLLYIFAAWGLGKLDIKDEKTKKWLTTILAILLAAMIANTGVTKNQIVIFGGWLSVLILGYIIGAKIAGKKEDDEEGSGFKKALGMAAGFAISYMFVELLANMLGTSLFGGEISMVGGDVSIWTVLKNGLIGLAIGLALWALVTPGGLSKWIYNKTKDKIKDMRNKSAEGKAGEAASDNLPALLRAGEKESALERSLMIKQYRKTLEQLNKMMMEELDKKNDAFNVRRAEALRREIAHVKQEIRGLAQEEIQAARQKQEREEAERKRLLGNAQPAGANP